MSPMDAGQALESIHAVTAFPASIAVTIAAEYASMTSKLEKAQSAVEVILVPVIQKAVKFQITSTKIQINLKSQISMSQTFTAIDQKGFARLATD